MPDNGKRKIYVLKAIHTLAKSWLCPLLVSEQDKATRKKGSVLHSKVATKGLGRRKKHLQHNIVNLISDIPTVSDR